MTKEPQASVETEGKSEFHSSSAPDDTESHPSVPQIEASAAPNETAPEAAAPAPASETEPEAAAPAPAGETEPKATAPDGGDQSEAVAVSEAEAEAPEGANEAEVETKLHAEVQQAASAEPPAEALPVAAAAADAAAASDPLDQVRELLFGEAKRNTEQNFHALEEKLEAMQADFLARIATLEKRLVDLSGEIVHDHAVSIDAIGSAIAQLGSTVQNLSARRKSD